LRLALLKNLTDILQLKITDIVHDYHDGITHLSAGLCRVRSFINLSKTVVLLTELDTTNDGTSVTNAVEYIIQSLIEQGKVIGPATFIEHYERADSQNDEFYLVALTETKGPDWKRITPQEVVALSGCTDFELAERSEANSRIYAQADRMRLARDHFVDSRFPENNEVIKRRLEILDGMVSKTDVERLVNAKAKEHDLQNLLRQDLSFFGEAYAELDGEYICFSELPIDDGFVDFVVFTGRSRMDVILIEVKGADFDLLTKTHYEEFSHKIHEAAGQIRRRVGTVHRDISKFKTVFHNIRIEAEKGKKIHNSFLGPNFRLQVDPNKDINIRTVVIGGRTVNDLEESRKRYDYESRVTPPIRIESWDTWLRRLKRQ
jgi:hypothetical protein